MIALVLAGVAMLAWQGHAALTAGAQSPASPAPVTTPASPPDSGLPGANASDAAATAGAPASLAQASPGQAALVARGAQLAALGDCASCHTAEDGRALAGGRPLATPFGTVYGTNLTPDVSTGLGRYSEAAFVRAMRDGVDVDGRHLYPVFPYDHFTHTDDADLHALYAYLTSRDPVHAETPAPKLAFPFNFRPLIAVWKRMYLHTGPLAQDPAHDGQWNRGAYLVEGLGHCGGCHTPRNRLGAERDERRYAGGVAEGWFAPGFDAPTQRRAPWTVESMVAYLRTGLDERHAMAAGPMRGVVDNLAGVPEEDLRAIAVYVVDHLQRSAAASPAGGREAGAGGGDDATAAHAAGREIYATTCAACHDAGRGASSESALELSTASSIAAPTPVNLLDKIVHGIVAREGERTRWMPAFDGALTDAQIVSLVRYLRARYSSEPPWKDLDDALAKLRREDAS